MSYGVFLISAPGQRVGNVRFSICAEFPTLDEARDEGSTLGCYGVNHQVSEVSPCGLCPVDECECSDE